MPCDHTDCDWCYPPVAPDDQARGEIEAYLNRPRERGINTELERAQRLTQRVGEVRFYRAVYEGQGRINKELPDRALIEAAEWEALYSIAVRQVLELREDVREAEAAASEERGRAGFLESALRHYAEHAWNDIKRMLEGGR